MFDPARQIYIGTKTAEIFCNLESNDFLTFQEEVKNGSTFYVSVTNNFVRNIDDIYDWSAMRAYS